MGGVAVLCEKAQPLQRMHSGHHWEEGSSDNPRVPELNRELCLELFAAVAALGNRMIFILGDWNFAPDDFPIDLLQGGQERSKLTGYSKALLPACGMEETTEKKHDNLAIKLDLDLEFVSQGYMGQRSYETAERNDPLAIAVEYEKQRDQHFARWSTALMSHDVDQLWQLCCSAAEQALGLPALSRGHLTLSKQQIMEQPPDEEARSSY
eukprot:3027054-Amphidinium_carterae.3